MIKIIKIQGKDRKGPQRVFVGIINIVALCVFVIGISLFLIVTPKNADDYLYLLHFRDWFVGQGIIFPDNGGNIFIAGFPLNESIDSIVEHYKLDNGRLGNIVATIFLIFPKWVGSGIAAVCFLYSVFGSFQLAGIDKYKSLLIVPGIFMFTFLLPWWENMGALTYQYNYLFSTFLGILLIFSLRNSDKYSRLKMTLIFIIGLATGCSHESISVPIFVGIAVVRMIMPEYRSTANLTALFGLGIGIIYLLMSPGMWTRIGSSGGAGIKFYISPYFLFTALPAITMTVMAIRGEKKQNSIDFFLNNKNSFLIFSVVSAWVSLLIVMVTQVPLRAGWWSIFISITGILFLLNNKKPLLARKCRLAGKILLLAMLFAVSLHLSAISANAIEQSREMEDIFKRSTVSNLECWFGNVKRLPALPLQSGITGASFVTDGFMYMKNYYLGLNRDTLIYSTVIPSELKYISRRSGKAVPGGSGIRVISGHLFDANSRFQDIDGSLVYMDVDFGMGYRSVPMRKYRFKSLADGRYYEYIEPVLGWYSSHFRTIKRIR